MNHQMSRPPQTEMIWQFANLGHSGERGKDMNSLREVAAHISLEILRKLFGNKSTFNSERYYSQVERFKDGYPFSYNA